MPDPIENTLKTIEENKMEPKPKWFFSSKNCLFWSFYAISIIFGALAVSTVIFMLDDYDYNIYGNLNRNLFQHTLIAIPYLWLAIFTVFVVLAYYNFKNTKRGYRFEIYKLILINLAISAALGIAFFFSGIDSEAHQMLSKKIPFYNALVYDDKSLWDNPSKGLLCGQVFKINTPKDFTLRGCHCSDCFWSIKEDNLIPYDRSLIIQGVWLKLVGQEIGNNVFMVNTIRPWGDRW